MVENETIREKSLKLLNRMQWANSNKNAVKRPITCPTDSLNSNQEPIRVLFACKQPPTGQDGRSPVIVSFIIRRWSAFEMTDKYVI